MPLYDFRCVVCGSVSSDSGRSDAAPDSVVPELYIGFRGDPFE